MTKEMTEDLIYWIGIGWEYQIIHKIMIRKYGYDISREEVRAIKDKFAIRNAALLSFT